MTESPATPAPEQLTFATDEGISLVASAWGDPDWPPVVFLHGGGQTRHSWGSAAASLARRGWRALSLDLRGHGDSGWSPAGHYLIDNFVGDVKRVVAEIGQPPVLVGASLGGIAALLAAGESGPELCRALVLVDIAPRTEEEGVKRIRDFMHASPQGFASLEEAADAVAAYRRHRSRPKDISGLSKNLRLKEAGRFYWHWDPRFIAHRLGPGGDQTARRRAAAAALQIPALLVRGAQSDVVSEEGVRDFLELVPHGRYVDVSDAGHMVAGDKNDAFSAAVMEFLAETPPTP
ncbi:MAG: alpha/beta hydrolase [bacterium]